MGLRIVNGVEWEIDTGILLYWVKQYFSTGVVRIPVDLLILVLYPFYLLQPNHKLLNISLPICKLRGLSPRANYTDRAAAAGRRS